MLRGGGKRGRAHADDIDHDDVNRRGAITPFHGEARALEIDSPQIIRVWSIKEINILCWLETMPLKDLLILDATVDKNIKILETDQSIRSLMPHVVEWAALEDLIKLWLNIIFIMTVHNFYYDSA